MMDGRNIAVGWFVPVKKISIKVKRANLIEGSIFDNKYRRITFNPGTTTFSINNLKKMPLCYVTGFIYCYSASHCSECLSAECHYTSICLRYNLNNYLTNI